jgi:hypothetical protein
MAATVEQLEKRVKTLEESLADSVAENKQLQSKLTSRTAEDIKAAGDEYDAITDSLVNLPSFAKEFGSAVVGSITDLSRGIGILEQQGTLIQQSFGVSRDRIEEFKTLIADVGPVLASIGISENEFASTITNITDKLGTAASLGAEAVTEIAAASKGSVCRHGARTQNH